MESNLHLTRNAMLAYPAFCYRWPKTSHFWASCVSQIQFPLHKPRAHLKQYLSKRGVCHQKQERRVLQRHTSFATIWKHKFHWTAATSSFVWVQQAQMGTTKVHTRVGGCRLQNFMYYLEKSLQVFMLWAKWGSFKLSTTSPNPTICRRHKIGTCLKDFLIL